MNGGRCVHNLPMGAQWMPNGGARFVAWAPEAAALGVRVWGRGPARAMHRFGKGWWELLAPDARPGDRYKLVLDGAELPDPGSRFQPEDAHGPSEFVNPHAYAWQIPWRGKPWEECVLYELHVGTFTPEGTFRAAIGKLDHLVNLGITALQIMPVADFPGSRNWGYDGVLPYAPDSSYGRPDDFKALIDAAHARGLAVLLDVVYNHFGPEANYLPRLAPQVFNARHRTPWGAAVNFDDAGSDVVREFVIHNALYWIEEYHLDGLRLDAVHAIRDDSELHVLDELAERVAFLDPQRPVHLVLENEHNEARRLQSYRAQWNDDVHHVLHVAATGESDGYYRAYGGDDTGRTRLLARALAEGFAYQGELMPGSGKRRGQRSDHLPPTAFVAFIQNHDHVGNRAFGERIGMLAPPGVVRAIAVVYLLLPQIPMLFMGEEWDCRRPFQYFCDFHGDLAEAVRRGRRAEFAQFPQFADPDRRDQIPDPQAPETFQNSKLDWDELANPDAAARLQWYRQVLQVRRSEIVPMLAGIHRGGSATVVGAQAVQVRWKCADGRILQLDANLSPQAVQFPPGDGRVLWTEGAVAEGGMYQPWTVRWRVSDIW